MQRAIKINQKTYDTLDNLKNKMFPFPVSYAKIVEYATDNLAQVYENAQKKIDQTLHPINLGLMHFNNL